MTTPAEIAAALVSLGCPREKSLVMAAQLQRRAEQLSKRTGKRQDEAVAHLLGLMKQGWAAQGKGP